MQIVGAVPAFGRVLAFAASARAQATDSLYRPTLSPWFGLYQRNGGPIDNYHMFVRPQMDLQNTIQQQQNAIQRNAAGINSLGQDVTQMQEHGTMKPTGTGSGFMNYSHYYPASRGGRAPQTQAASAATSSPQAASSSGRSMAATSSMGSMPRGY